MSASRSPGERNAAGEFVCAFAVEVFWEMPVKLYKPGAVIKEQGSFHCKGSISSPDRVFLPSAASTIL
jgi:hypothetical protein